MTREGVAARRLSRAPVERVVVVVPARDEQELLPGCLDSLGRAVRAAPVPVTVVVVLDRCVDATAAVLAVRPEVLAVTSDAGCVGVARRVGVEAGLAAVDGTPATRTWVMSTDADSRVPQDWVGRQLELADSGVDLVLGTVQLPAESALGPLGSRWRNAYERVVGPGGTHPHVHGANLGVRASRYLAAGGFPAREAHEDVLLARAVAALPGATVVSSVAAPVTTSDRLLGRAPVGVAADLRSLGSETG